MEIFNQINRNPDFFKKICESENISQLFAFGSVIRDDFNENSDIDLLIKIDEQDPLTRGEKLLAAWSKLEEFFKRRVDLLTENSIKNPVLKDTIMKSKVLIYER